MALFIFRRDLRIHDNNALNYAIDNFDEIIPIFIFTPEQVSNKNNFKSNNSIQFMVESLQNLNDELKKYNSKLHLFYGDNAKVIKSIINKINIHTIVFNTDYTPYAINRDKSIKQLCERENINCIMMEDYLLDKIGTLNKQNGDPYLVYTPFKNNAMKHKIDEPYIRRNFNNLVKKNISGSTDFIKYDKNNDILVHGGRDEGLKMLNKINDLKDYNKFRNMLDYDTSQLSAYIKFGCISIREAYWKIKDNLTARNDLIAQLIWREFYYYIAYYFPDVLNGYNFNKKFDGIKWNKNKNNFNKWCNGETGYPIVDAGMIELNTTGYMHNRARLITANFMNRLLGYDWLLGEQYYATQLTDYDPSVNNGNWQWIASTGVDTKPYNQRVFNPWTQSKKYDPDAFYIKKWLPQLKNIPENELHNWDKHFHKYNLKDIKYFEPIVDYEDAREMSLKMYK